MNVNHWGRFNLILSLACGMSTLTQAAEPADDPSSITPQSVRGAVATFVGEVVPWHSIEGQTERVWTEAETGRTATGTLIAANLDSARVRRSDGKVIAIALVRLHSEDRVHVQAALPVVRRVVARLITPNDRESIETSTKGSLVDQVREWLPAARGTEPAMLQVWQTLIDRDPSAATSNEKTSLPGNLIYVRLSQPFLNGFLAEQVDRQHPVSEIMLGHHVTGTSRLRGGVELALLPSNEGGRAELQFRGASTFQTVAHADRVRVRTNGTTEFLARKTLKVDEHGIAVSPASTTATTRSAIVGIDTQLPRLRGRIATRIAESRAADSKRQSQAITARRTADRINRRFDQTVNEQVQNGEREMLSQLARFGQLAEFAGYDVKFRTTNDLLEVVIFGADAEEQIIATAPAARPEMPDVEIQIHAALVQRLMTDGDFQARLKPVFDMLTSSQKRTMMSLVGFSEISGKANYHARWSDDRNWFTLVWNTPVEGKEAEGKASDTLVTRERTPAKSNPGSTNRLSARQ